MNKFVFLTYGFEKPTAEIMEKWQAWFASIKDNIVEQGHFPRGVEISAKGRKEMPLGPSSITGYIIVTAEDMAAAETMAQTNPYIDSIRVYEVMSR